MDSDLDELVDDWTLANLTKGVVRQLQRSGVAPATRDHSVSVAGRCNDHGRPGARGQGLIQTNDVQPGLATTGF